MRNRTCHRFQQSRTNIVIGNPRSVRMGCHTSIPYQTDRGCCSEQSYICIFGTFVVLEQMGCNEPYGRMCRTLCGCGGCGGGVVFGFGFGVVCALNPVLKRSVRHQTNPIHCPIPHPWKRRKHGHDYSCVAVLTVCQPFTFGRGYT